MNKINEKQPHRLVGEIISHIFEYIAISAEEDENNFRLQYNNADIYVSISQRAISVFSKKHICINISDSATSALSQCIYQALDARDRRIERDRLLYEEIKDTEKWLAGQGRFL